MFFSQLGGDSGNESDVEDDEEFLAEVRTACVTFLCVLLKVRDIVLHYLNATTEVVLNNNYLLLILCSKFHHTKHLGN